MTSVYTAAYTDIPLDLEVDPSMEWVLDCFCGTESNLEECQSRGWSYVGVDIEGSFRVDRPGDRVEARLILDLSTGWLLGKLFALIYSVTGLLPQHCRLIWYSPPCEFYSFLNRPYDRHRYWKQRSFPPKPGLPTIVDHMIRGIILDDTA